MTDADLRVGGRVYSGWTSVGITKSMEQFAHSFRIQATDRWDDEGRDIAPIPIEVGDKFKLDVEDERLITGYIVARQGSYDANSRTLGFTGASKTVDLVDCSAIYRTGGWRNETLLKIAKNLCDPFGITVRASVQIDQRLRKFEIEDGETVFNALSRLARRRSALLLTDSDGNVLFDRVSTTRIGTILKLGDNILKGSLSENWSSRFSEYRVKAQTSGSNELFGSNTSLKRSADDDGVDRYRPMVILADNESNGTELKKRATWERNTRAGKSKRYRCTVHGWRHSDGFWAPNTLVKVEDEQERLNDTLLIVSVTFSKSNSGTLTDLEMTLPEAFDVQPLPRPKKKAGSFL